MRQRDLGRCDLLPRDDQVANVLPGNRVPHAVRRADDDRLRRLRAVPESVAPHVGLDGDHPRLRLQLHVEVAQSPRWLQALDAAIHHDAAEIPDPPPLLGSTRLVVPRHPRHALDLCGRARRLRHLHDDEAAAAISEVRAPDVRPGDGAAADACARRGGHVLQRVLDLAHREEVGLVHRAATPQVLLQRHRQLPRHEVARRLGVVAIENPDGVVGHAAVAVPEGHGAILVLVASAIIFCGVRGELDPAQQLGLRQLLLDVGQLPARHRALIGN
mmetsp:Transcript_34864/g.99211  ORF Transcript_34864/g.99211 Transcript_34864/m.99211 type:complete len:273 (+) Transcript_34864:188-1006(+)